MNDVRASRRRVAKFAIPTLMCCILINIPKFFESKIEYYQDEYGNQIGKYFFFLLKKSSQRVGRKFYD